MSEALTYDDVLLVPSYNHWESRKVVDTNITDRSGLLSLEIPVMTSNMDTITEVDMANFIRSKGGVGVLHRFMSIEENGEINHGDKLLSDPEEEQYEFAYQVLNPSP